MANYDKLQKLLDIHFASAMQDVNTSMPVQVVEIIGNKVSVKPLIKGKKALPDGSVKDFELPIIPNVIVGGLFAGGFAIEMPISVGDVGSIKVFQRDSRNWANTRSISAQKTNRRFNINDCIYCPDIQPISGTIPKDEIKMSNASGLYFSLKADKIETNMNVEITGNVTVTGNITATGTVTASEFTSTTTGVNFNNHVHGGVTAGNNNTGGPQ